MTEAILSPLTPGQMEEPRKWLTGSGTVRRCILHAISHYAAHLGHMQLTYQLWVDQVGKVQLASNPDRIAAGRETSTEGRGKKGIDLPPREMKGEAMPLLPSVPAGPQRTV